ncbi:MAG: hypothetical protein Q9200_003012 [Gallowayella weberi]
MGSITAPITDADAAQKNKNHNEITPFGKNKINPSHLIASSLPSSFGVNVTDDDDDNDNVTVKIITASPIPVLYRTVRHVVPRLLFPQPHKNAVTAAVTRSYPPSVPPPTAPFADLLSLPAVDEDDDDGSADIVAGQRRPFDFILHIGMAAPREFYTMETCAHRDRYIARDEGGETMEGDTLWRDGYKAPEILRPGFDVEDVWRRWKEGLMDVDVRPSKDAGRFLCDFIYYTSLVEYWRRDPEAMAPVMFLHVPGGVEDLDIDRGRKVALGLVGAMVGSARRTKDAGDNDR